ncbi:ABC transporter ATP-binding protein [Paenibacillus physcomitrellae]|uniref:ABC transporter ATP-binding protein n=1 Tax=Paenibacillus physcomitrellae TaxID=1619311 RepID=A0ABQ1GCQ4_9BACL|nr:ABC transporter ATP-binding protein [Paenibacillus physcomitrellae]GGA41121.1 ABC transporter ATP-binding protein [Paenibacillus physcomitrellae]
MAELLEIDNLITEFSIRKQWIAAVRGVSLELKKGSTLVVLGESGSGKSVMLRSVLGLKPSGARLSGSIKLAGDEMLSKSAKEMERIRGGRIAMIFQDALSALDPLYRVGDQIIETIRSHERVNFSEAQRRTIELLRRVGIPSPEERMRAFPHEMSGGMRQRAVIAMALACNPDLLLADEPTTALDVTIQAQILRLFKEIQKDFGMSIVLVTHDIGVAAEMADDIAVMYAGKIVEHGSAGQVLSRPQHPYTQGLIGATPRKGQTGRLPTIPGYPPLITEMPHGCSFASRCPKAGPGCREQTPLFVRYDEDHGAACLLLEEKLQAEF